MVKGSTSGAQAAEEPKPLAPPRPEKLLTEIRDLLAKRA